MKWLENPNVIQFDRFCHILANRIRSVPDSGGSEAIAATESTY
jgi:hypothetical protein